MVLGKSLNLRASVPALKIGGEDRSVVAEVEGNDTHKAFSSGSGTQ